MPKTKSKRNRIVLITAIVAVLGAGIWYFTAAKPASQKAVSKTDSKATAEVAKADDLDKPTDTKDASGDAKTTTATTSAANLGVIVNRPVNGDTLPMSEGIEFRSTITGTTTGSCMLNLIGPSGQKLTKNANLTAQNGYASCAINVPGSELVTGVWTLSFTATSGATTTKPIVEKVTMQ